jgi:hypothetical protein
MTKKEIEKSDLKKPMKQIKVKNIQKKKSQWVKEVLKTKRKNQITFKDALVLASSNRKSAIS